MQVLEKTRKASCNSSSIFRTEGDGTKYWEKKPGFYCFEKYMHLAKVTKHPDIQKEVKRMCSHKTNSLLQSRQLRKHIAAADLDTDHQQIGAQCMKSSPCFTGMHKCYQAQSINNGRT